jgi:hypothetical protein
MLENACKRLRDPEWNARFVALEPPNKWGTLKDAVWVMDKLLEAARDYRDLTWLVH